MADCLIVFGCGGHAKVVVEAVMASAPDREIVLLDDAEERKGESIFGITVSGGREQLDRLRNVPIALGIGNNQARSRLMRELAGQGRTLESVIHPAASIGKSVKIGEGAFVGAGAVAIADARIGVGAIINTGATVDHDCQIGEAAHVAPGAHLCGNVRIGERTLVGVGSAINPGISIAPDVIIGAGAVVVRDISSPGTYAGNPAHTLRLR